MGTGIYTNVFTLDRIPDLSLVQYCVEEGNGVDDVIRQHGTFYRQLNRRGILFGEIYHLIYIYDPVARPGEKMKIYFRTDSPESPVCLEALMNSSSISAYYKFRQVTDKKDVTDPEFKCRASLVKKDGMVSSSLADQRISYYTVSDWEMNDDARLIGLFRMMKELNAPVAYVATIKSVDLSADKRLSEEIDFFRRRVKQSGVTGRDENGEKCLKAYDKLLENLRKNPHFICRFSAYAQREDLAKLILDSAVSEAVEEGNYRIVSDTGSYRPLYPQLSIEDCSPESTPDSMRVWNRLFFWKEMMHLSMLPVLYPGETIEIPKESAPVYESDGLHLGKDKAGYDVYYPVKLLNKHAFLAGVPGSGKTNSMLYLASQIGGSAEGYHYNIPFLILEPAKKEYRQMIFDKHVPDFLVFSPGGTDYAPLRINPFEFPIGVKVSEHMTRLYEVFEGAFGLEPPMPYILRDAIEEVYADCGWYYYEVNDGKHQYPTMEQLFKKTEVIVESKGYDSEIKGNITSFIQTRIGSLLSRETGNVFNVSSSSVRPHEWFNLKCVIELEPLGRFVGNFLTLLLLTIIREQLSVDAGSIPKDKPKHVIFLEEAHNIIGPTAINNGENNGDPKVAATKFIVDMLAEVRALGEAIVIADQLPTALAPEVTKNTSFKVGHRITAIDDRQFLGITMSADEVQLEKMAGFTPGQGLVSYENVKKPFEIKMADYNSVESAQDASDSRKQPPTDEMLLELMRDKSQYATLRQRDRIIMVKRFKEKHGEKLRVFQRLNMEKNEPEKLMKFFFDWYGIILEMHRYAGKNPLEAKVVFEELLGMTDEYLKGLEQLNESMLVNPGEKEKLDAFKKQQENRIKRDLSGK